MTPNRVGTGVGLLLWGALAICWIDNLVRPLVISGVAKIPFVLVLFGVLGEIGRASCRERVCT